MNLFSSLFKNGSEKDEGKNLGMDEQKTETQAPGQGMPLPQASTAMPQNNVPATHEQPAATEEGERKGMPVVEPGSIEEQIKGALRQVYDPEIGLEVVQLGLIREIDLKGETPEIKMVLTTPFCPYGGWLIQQVKDISESISGMPIKITVLPDLWDPNYMEDPGLLMGW
jgi:metal-sulfur cluster biosynthetic enzyme